MNEPKREELNVKTKPAVLAGVLDPANRNTEDEQLTELRGLAQTAGVQIEDILVQYRDRPHPGTCFGSGKLEELSELVKRVDAEIVIFDNNLSPAQGRNIEQACDCVIVDRSELILDIFATRAQTYEARLQVELAQLLYFRPRLKRLWTHLERIEGGIGTGRGPGEKQLETDRRLVDRRISELKRKLGSVEKRRERTVAGRSQQTTVSLVGYTNAGKSTLMRALTAADVLVADKLFATLDTRTRRWQIRNWGEVLLSDTVGFVRNLPHHLVASFKSTLEEARHSDLLLHVVDSSHPDAARQIETVHDVLSEIGVEWADEVLVFNKIDAQPDRSYVDVLRAQFDRSVSVSAIDGTGFDALQRAVADRLSDGYCEAQIETHVGNGKLFAYLAEHGEVTNRQYNESRVTLDCRLPRRFAEQIGRDDTTVRFLSNGR